MPILPTLGVPCLLQMMNLPPTAAFSVFFFWLQNPFNIDCEADIEHLSTVVFTHPLPVSQASVVYHDSTTEKFSSFAYSRSLAELTYTFDGEQDPTAVLIYEGLAATIRRTLCLDRDYKQLLADEPHIRQNIQCRKLDAIPVSRVLEFNMKLENKEVRQGETLSQAQTDDLTDMIYAEAEDEQTLKSIEDDMQKLRREMDKARELWSATWHEVDCMLNSVWVKCCYTALAFSGV